MSPVSQISSLTAPSPRRVVIAGGAGFLGSHLVDALLARGDHVTVLDDLSTGLLSNLNDALAPGVRAGVEVIEHDVSEPLPPLGRVDVVAHLASPASPKQYARLPVHTLRAGSLGTLHLLELATRWRARFVLASTSEVYGEPSEHPQREGYWGNVNPVGPRSCYDEAKRFAEAATSAYVRSHGTNAGIVRLFNCYGPRMAADDGRVVPTLLRQVISGQALTVTGDGVQTRSCCYVDDVVDAFVAMIGSDVRGPVNIGNPEEVTIADLAATISRLAGRSHQTRHVPRPVDDPSRRKPDITLARTQLGWAPRVSLTEGLTATLKWLREEAQPAARSATPSSPVPRSATTPAPLTERETEVLRCMALGLTNRGIQKRLFLSERTVEAHIRSIFTKLDLPAREDHHRRVLAVISCIEDSAKVS